MVLIAAETTQTDRQKEVLVCARMRILALLACVAACGDNVSADVTIVTANWQDALGDFQAVGANVVTGDTATGDGLQVLVTDDDQIPAEGYRVDQDPGHLTVHAHDVLGAQYGVAAALESVGYRFRHPFDPYIPGRLYPGTGYGELHTPSIRVRGFHIHTLHPIEGHYALWLGRPEEARRIIDWVVWNRGNYIQWAALDDIQNDARRADWQAFTSELIDYAHARGVRVGVNPQLFAQASLQHSLTFVQDMTTPVADQIAERLPYLTDVGFDVLDLSFGEFFDADPQAFIDGVNEVRNQLRTLAPNAEMHTIVHMGGNQRATYMGQDVPYYFLVKFADPSIIPDIHSVMYFDLFEDAGGAYQMPDFHEHRQYLLDRMCANQKGSYHPEDAYWIAFDDSVPQFLPLYVRSRKFDLEQLALAAPPPCSPLDEHLVFSSGWEWGYWLQDVAVMRGSYDASKSYQDLIADALAPELTPSAAVVTALADLQHDALIDERLAPYLASRDALIDAGRSLDIISQPDRMTFDDLVAATPDAVAAFQDNVMTPLVTYAQNVDALDSRFAALDLPESRWSRELRDGLLIDRHRAHFIYNAYAAVLAHLNGDEAAAKAARDRAEVELNTAAAIVAERHADMHDNDKTLITRGDNSTVYGFGYLYMTDQLCFWHRELDQVDGVLGNSSMVPPACVL